MKGTGVAVFLITLSFGFLSCTKKVSVKRASPLTGVEVLSAVDGHFQKAVQVRPFVFPQDHFSHPTFKTEWWYWTGHLESGAQKFGYQLTFFRSSNSNPLRKTPWNSSETWMAHFALSDVSEKKFFAFEKFERGGHLGLAGVNPQEKIIFLHGWTAQILKLDPLTLVLSASLPPDGKKLLSPLKLDLSLTASKPLTLQGEHGLSWKNGQKTNASYYYSSSRMATEGKLQLEGKTLSVTGDSCLDREWSSGALAPNQAGWDWFSLQLNDGTDVMLFQIREKNDGAGFRSGTLIPRLGQSHAIEPLTIQMKPLQKWTSPSGSQYPATWTLRWENGPTYTVRPLLPDQELRLKFKYWEGAVQLFTDDGKIAGRGFLEMTGY